MEDENRTSTATVTSPAQEAVDAEIARIIREAESVFQVRAGGYRPFLFRIIREIRPDITRERWREIANRTPDVSMVNPNQADQDRQADIELLRRHGYEPCCPACDGPNLRRARELERERGGQEEAPQERTCTCNGCTEPECQSDCEPCDDHGCEQCFPEDDHSTYTCCGYCPSCDNHPNGAEGDDVCDHCHHCPECDHHCD